MAYVYDIGSFIAEKHTVTLLLFQIEKKWRAACNVHVWTVAPPGGEQQHLMHLNKFWGTAGFNWFSHTDPFQYHHFLYLCIYIVFVILDTIHTLCDFIDVFLTAQLL